MELTPRNTAASSSSILVTFFIKCVNSAIRHAFSIVAFLLKTPQCGEQLDKDACFSDETICMADLKVVMRRLGMAWEDDSDDDDDEESERIISIHELTSILVDEKPSMAEVKRCFEVFDENGNGFIEAYELQRVLLCLGLKEGYELEDCDRMIWAFDENGDGLIDLGEFAKLMAQISI